MIGRAGRTAWRACATTIVLTFASPVWCADAVADALVHLRQRGSESRSDALYIQRGDTVLLDEATASSPEPIELMSATKSVVALVVGRLVTQGRIASIDQPVSDWYPEWKQGRKKGITLRMLLDHTSGLQDLPTTTQEVHPASDVVQLALAAELDAYPGARFFYSNKAVNLIAGIVQRAAGMPMDVYARTELFAPLGIAAGDWMKDAAGNPHAYAGLSLTAHDAARLGRLVLQRGAWSGTPLIDPAYIDAMLAASAASDEVGLLWWRRPAWLHFSIDARTFAMLDEKQIDAALIDALRPLDGQRYDSFAALAAALETALGPDWRGRWQRQVVATSGIGPYRAFHWEAGPTSAYEAQGYLGQYIVVIPATDLVGVRQIKERDDYAPGDSFDDFTDAMLKFSAALEGEVAP